nr:immunoglobulin light chain junction region [Macaca mulatta]MOV34756.1 immunoglobulin light chain junction region [Macaca mulatta]MOV35260.1 immunoglobulin light chain junction region [Macaca mulatta]
CMQSTGFPFTF